MQKIILLSILPEWANAILSGSKKWEYRRVPPKNAQGAKVLLYSSGNCQSIVGEFTIEMIYRAPLKKLIPMTLAETPHSSENVYRYFADLEMASALKISSPKKYKIPLHLNNIRQLIPNFMPPQNFIYLNKDDPKIVKLLRLFSVAKHQPHQTNLFKFL